MKKLSILLVLVLVLTALTACSSPDNYFTDTSGNNDTVDPSTPTTPAETTGSVPADTTGSTPSQDNKVEGKYCGSYTYDGNEFYVEITINADGTYKRVYMKNGEPYKSQEGDWVMDNSGRTPRIRIYLDAAHSVANVYDYMGSYLKEGSKTFTKQ